MIRKILGYIGEYLDQRQVMKSIYQKLHREVKRAPNITLGEAVYNLWADLDCALVGTSEKHQINRVRVFRRAPDKLNMDEANTAKALEYLAIRSIT